LQSDLFPDLPSVTICPLTSTIRDDADLIRLTVDPSHANGLRQVSQIVIDKMTTVRVAKIGGEIGHADDSYHSWSRSIAPSRCFLASCDLPLRRGHT
jgi:mRNA interferase MazF